MYSKTCLKRPLKMDKTKVLTTNGSFMMVKSIAECLAHSTLLLTCIKHYAVLKANFGIFWSGRLRQV